MTRRHGRAPRGERVHGHGPKHSGAHLAYLPPYSPDFMPMEPGWSHVKTAPRAAAARPRAALDRGLTWALAQITPQDARGWFRLCGCRLH